MFGVVEHDASRGGPCRLADHRSDVVDPAIGGGTFADRRDRDPLPAPGAVNVACVYRDVDPDRREICDHVDILVVADELAERYVLLDHRARDQRTHLVGGHALIAFDDRQGLSLLDRVPEPLADLAGDPGEAGHDVREPIGVGNDFSGEIECHANRSCRGGFDLDARRHTRLGGKLDMRTFFLMRLMTFRMCGRFSSVVVFVL